MDQSQIHELIQISSKDLQIDPSAMTKLSNMESLKHWLAREIEYLLQKDFQKLVDLLYRIDVGEEQVKEVFASTESNSLSIKLAELIIDRELKKVATRRKYR